MRTPGALVVDPEFALAFRVLEPAPPQPASLLVLLHGVGGNENNLATVGAGVAADTLVVLPRGPIALAPGQFAWFRVAFAADGPRIVEAEADASRRTLVEFVAQLQRAHGIDARRTTIAGFSQGGILSASVALSAPDRVAAFAMLAGRILPELQPHVAHPEALSGLRALVAHGRHDDKLPPDWAHRASAWLDRLGVEHALRLYPTGHELGPGMRTDFLAWLAAGPRDQPT